MPGPVREVFRAVEKIRTSSSGNASLPLRPVVITEDMLNAWIAFRIDREREEILRELRLELLRKNRVRGRVVFDLQGAPLPRMLKRSMIFSFEGRLMAEKGRVKFQVHKLFWGGKSVPLFLLDLTLLVASQLDRENDVSLDRWYDLPRGLRDIYVTGGKAILYY